MTNPCNVLFITADQFRSDALSCMGHPLVRTPNLDRLAAEGALFRNHFGQCAPCGPSRTSLLTGMYLMNHRSVQNGTPLDAGFTNLALEVRKGGVEPWLIGYTDTTQDPRRFHPDDPRVRRYEELLPGIQQYAPGSEWGLTDTDWMRHLADLGYPVDAVLPYQQVPDFPDAAHRGPTYAPAIYKAEHSDTAYTTDRALRFLRQHRWTPRAKSWFLHVSYLRPHPPWVAPAPYHDMYAPDDVPDAACLADPDAEAAMHPFMGFRMKRLPIPEGLERPGHPNDSLHWRQVRATYYGLITELDAQLGRLFQALKETGEDERTLIVLTADHGEQLGDHWSFGKELPFDRSVRTPLIIRAPRRGGQPGQVVDRFSEHVDVMPTILDYLGIEIPLQCDGHSLRGFLEGGEPADWRTEVHWEYDFRNVFDDAAERELGIKLDQCSMGVIRDRRWKYIHFAALPPMLFDIAADPGELVNLAGDPAHRDVMLRYAQKMLSWRMDYARRELTGVRILDGRIETAARGRRIV